MIGKRFSHKTIITVVSIFVTFVVILTLWITISPEYKKRRELRQTAERWYQEALSYKEQQSVSDVKYVRFFCF